MRISALCLGISLTCCIPIIAHADEPLPYVVGPPVPCMHLPPNSIYIGPIICKDVMLRDEASLAQLKKSNPDDYAIAMRVIEAASQLCTAGAPEPRIVGLKEHDVACSAFILPTDPPKRTVWFVVGHTLYRVLVAVQI